MRVSPQARNKDTCLPLTREVRTITRELDGKPRTLFTSLMDPARYKADEVFALYHERSEPEPNGALIHHSGIGSQYVQHPRYSERLAEAGIEPSMGSEGDSYDNALAETINGL